MSRDTYPPIPTYTCILAHTRTFVCVSMYIQFILLRIQCTLSIWDLKSFFSSGTFSAILSSEMPPSHSLFRLPAPGCRDSPVFFQEVLQFYLLHFHLLFISNSLLFKGWERLWLICSHGNSQFFWHHLLKTLSFPHWIALATLLINFLKRI